MLRFVPACAAAVAIAGLPLSAQALDPEKSMRAYQVANRCFAVTDAMSKTELPSAGAKRLDQMLFWGVAAKEFGDEAKISEAEQRQHMEAAAAKADADVAKNDPGAEHDLAQCEQAFRTAFQDTGSPKRR
jgi:hypothetical protein